MIEKFKKNLTFNFLFTILSTLSTFVLMKFIFSYFNNDQENYGLWLMVFSIISYIYIMDFGLSNGLRNLITPYIGKNQEKVNTYISNNFSFILIISIFLLIIINLVLFNIPLDFMENINGFKVDILIFKQFLIFLFNLQILYFFFSGIKPVFHAYAMSYLINLSQFLGNLLTIFLVILSNIYGVNNNWLLLAGIFVGSQIIVIIILTSIIVTQKKIKLSLRFDKIILKKLFNLGSKFFFLQLSNLILYNSLPILIGIGLTLKDASKFQLSYKLLSVFVMIFTIIMSPIWTLILEKSEAKDFIGIKNVFNILIKVIGMFSGIIIICSLFLNKIIFIWMGENFKITFLFSILMAIYIIFCIICSVLQSILNGLNIFKSQIIGYTFGAFSLIILTLIFNNLKILTLNEFAILGIFSLLVPSSLMLISFNKFIKRRI